MTKGDAALQRLLRELSPQVIGAVGKRGRDFAAVEDAVQEALLAASQQWPARGVPENPRAWLIHVALRRLTDVARNEIARRHREQLVVSLIPQDEQIALAADEAFVERDDTLDLLFMCCHPSLTTASAVALTLRAVGGLTTAEIARAFLVPEPTMAQRISRAKQTLRESSVPFDPMKPEERARRLEPVMHILYLVFNEGYAATSGERVERTDLSAEALRLTRLLHRLMPESGEVAGLLALMLLTDARRLARTGPNGELIPLDEQDRRLWDRAAIDEGVALLEETLPRHTPGRYQVQAAIAAVHDSAKSADDTDWEEILALYTLLERLDESPMVALSKAIAYAMVNGPREGLRRLDEVAKDPRLSGSHRVDAARAHLLERAGELDEAAKSFASAAERTTSSAERNYLLTRAARLRDGT